MKRTIAIALAAALLAVTGTTAAVMANQPVNEKFPHERMVEIRAMMNNHPN